MESSIVILEAINPYKLERVLDFMVTKKEKEQHPFLHLCYEGEKSRELNIILGVMHGMGLRDEKHYVLTGGPWIDCLETATKTSSERIFLMSYDGVSPISVIQNWGVDGYEAIIDFLKIGERRIKSYLERI